MDNLENKENSYACKVRSYIIIVYQYEHSSYSCKHYYITYAYH